MKCCQHEIYELHKYILDIHYPCYMLTFSADYTKHAIKTDQTSQVMQLQNHNIYYFARLLALLFVYWQRIDILDLSDTM